MSPVTLEGDTLGNKRRHYNKLVEDAVANKQYELLCMISGDDSDIDNLLKIDIASRNRYVHYIIEVMKSKDMLYAATAIKKSTWLITEQQYANIINPEYLHTQLLPCMNTKTFNKLMLHIRLNLKDETRVETFYEYLKDTNSGYKWLQNCSIPFIKNVIKNERLVPLSLIKRLCRRSADLAAFCTREELNSTKHLKNNIMFLLKSHTEDVLNVVESNSYCAAMGKKKSEFLMKNHSQRVISNFDKYADTVDLSILAKYLNKNEIKVFLYKHAKILGARLHDHDTLRHFIKNMPREERFQFAKKTFIDKTELSSLFSEDERRIIESKVEPYQWYEFAPFDVALTELTKLIRRELVPSERIAMLSVLITCTRKNPEHVQTLLKFVKDNHINEPFKCKIQFVNNLLSQISTHEFDVETWDILDQLFRSMKVYTVSEHRESNKNVQLCLQSIFLYKVLNDEPVPPIIEQKMSFYTFKKFKWKLNQEQYGKLFTYLFNSVLAKVESGNIANESDFSKAVVRLNNALTLIKDWKKDVTRYPFLLVKIQDLVKIKQENMWKTDMSCLYNVKKSWRKHMFSESLSLCLSEEACLNALKHKPQLLTRHDKDIDTLRTNDAVSLRRLLAKLRVYWPHSLARDWTDAYLLSLNNPIAQKAAIRGLFMLLSQNQVIDMAKKYVPEDFKINWDEIDQTILRMRKYIAKNLHIARPQVPLDTILWYAKGDYLQYAVPSLEAVLSNLSEVESREHVQKLLQPPVSLQKFGLRLVFVKLNPDELNSVYTEVWTTTENIVIRSVIFLLTYERMCNVKNVTDEKLLWELLNTFLPYVFVGKLGHVNKVPISVRSQYYMKCYVAINALPRNQNFESYVEDLIEYAPKIMDTLDNEFVADTILSPAVFKFCLYESQFIEIFACYVLCGKSQEDQVHRFRSVVEPAIDEAFQLWDSVHLDCYFVKNNFTKFIKCLVWNFTIYFSLNKIPIPVKLFVEIGIKMAKGLSLMQNYVLCTSFKIITEYLKIMDEDGTASFVYETLHFYEPDHENGQMSIKRQAALLSIHNRVIAPLLGPIIVECLKEDTKQYSQTIHYLFADAFEKVFELFGFFHGYFRDRSILETLKYMLDDNDFIPIYLVVSQVIPKHCNDDELKSQQSEIQKKLRSHPSKIVQMHYYNDFRGITENSPLVTEPMSKMCCEVM